MQTTITLTLLSFALALIVGVVVASFRVSPIPPLRWVGTAYVEVFRNIPLTVQFLLAFFGLPKLGYLMGGYPTAIMVLSLYTAAFCAEAVRSGINSVSKGQAEAARSLGLGFTSVLGTIVIPQALRTVVGPLGGIFVALIKNSSVALVIAVADLTFTTDKLANDTAQALPVFFGAACAYLIMTVPSGFAISAIEKKVAIKR